MALSICNDVFYIITSGEIMIIFCDKYSNNDTQFQVLFTQHWHFETQWQLQVRMTAFNVDSDDQILTVKSLI